MRVPCRPAAAPLINVDQLSDFANRIKPGAQICMVKAWPTRENYQRRFLSKAGCCIQSAPNYIKIEFRPVDAQFHVEVSFDSSGPCTILFSPASLDSFMLCPDDPYSCFALVFACWPRQRSRRSIPLSVFTL